MVSIVIRNSVIVAVSVFYEPYKYGTHAEKNAIMNVKNKKILHKCKMIIVKIYNGNIITCDPCPMCKKLMDKYKIIQKK